MTETSLVSFTMNDLINAGLVSRAGVNFAHYIASDSSLTVQIAAALAVTATQRSHSNLDLARIADDLGDHVAWPSIETWVSELEQSPLVQRLSASHPATHDFDRAAFDPPSSDGPPLTLRGTQLFLRRFDHDEQQIARTLSYLLTRDDDATRPHNLSALFATSERDPSNTSLQAAELLVSGALSVLTGGPGTGKTFTIARTIAAMWQVNPDTTIALAAPTGKAAMRMKQAVLQAIPSVDGQLSQQLQELEAHTLHRLLGLRPGQPPRHSRYSPLPHDVVIVDEVSMVSLPLMADLMQALRPDARLILVGDPHQLASVEAGSILRDLVDHRAPTRTRVAELTVNHRSVPLLETLFSAVNRGDGDEVVEILRSADPAVIQWIETADDATIPEIDAATDDLLRRVVTPHALGLIAAARVETIEIAHAELVDTKLLCATRNGALGSGRWQLRVERMLRPKSERHRTWYVGRPVMATRNDYITGLLNGDAGVCLGDTVSFPDSGNFGIEQLHDIETWWAMTIHKSQGSEFRHAIVSLDAATRLNTRELLYTAITRAKEQLTVVASEATLRQATKRQAVRSSGLLDKLAAASEASIEPKPAQLSLELG